MRDRKPGTGKDLGWPGNESWFHVQIEFLQGRIETGHLHRKGNKRRVYQFGDKCFPPKRLNLPRRPCCSFPITLYLLDPSLSTLPWSTITAAAPKVAKTNCQVVTRVQPPKCEALRALTFLLPCPKPPLCTSCPIISPVSGKLLQEAT